MKVLINRAFGGFALSQDVYTALIARGWTTTVFRGGGCEDDSARLVNTCADFDGDPSLRWAFVTDDEDSKALGLRGDPDLVAVVEELGTQKSSAGSSKLLIVEIPDDVEWHIQEHSGWEHVAENHRTWP